MSVENYIIRALNVTRLSSDNLWKLQQREIAIGRAFGAQEIQEVFHIDTAKSAWGIPDKNEDCAKHNARLRKEMAEKGLVPKHDFTHGDLDEIHKFDDQIRSAYEKMDIDLSYQGGKKSFRKQLEEEDRKALAAGE